MPIVNLQLPIEKRRSRLCLWRIARTFAKGKKMARKAPPAAAPNVNLDSVRFINPAQVGGIETAVLDDVPGRGTRIAWVNTGSPLRYKVVIDRGLDIADAFYGPHSLAFLSYTGITRPERGLDGGLDWLRGAYMGLLTSCGPQHVGAPETEGSIAYGLHGTHSNTPAALECICQPDPAAGVDTLNITGQVRTARLFGPNIELRRSIRSVLGRAEILIHDEFLNRGNAPARHAWLLHINLGWPLLDEGAKLVWRGKLKPRGDKDSLDWFKDPSKRLTIPAPVEKHRAAGEAVAFVDVEADGEGDCHAGLVNEKLGLGLEIIFPKKHFPIMANWQHFGPGGEYVTGLEPFAGGMGCGIPIGSLQPGETRPYDCTIRVLDGAKAIKQFEQQWG